jgi:hypothetical protein
MKDMAFDAMDPTALKTIYMSSTVNAIAIMKRNSTIVYITKYILAFCLLLALFVAFKNELIYSKLSLLA